MATSWTSPAKRKRGSWPAPSVVAKEATIPAASSSLRWPSAGSASARLAQGQHAHRAPSAAPGRQRTCCSRVARRFVTRCQPPDHSCRVVEDVDIANLPAGDRRPARREEHQQPTGGANWSVGSGPRRARCRHALPRVVGGGRRWQNLPGAGDRLPRRALQWTHGGGGRIKLRRTRTFHGDIFQFEVRDGQARDLLVTDYGFVTEATEARGSRRAHRQSRRCQVLALTGSGVMKAGVRGRGHLEERGSSPATSCNWKDQRLLGVARRPDHPRAQVEQSATQGELTRRAARRGCRFQRRRHHIEQGGFESTDGLKAGIRPTVALNLRWQAIAAAAE